MCRICKILESLSFAAETYFCEFLSYPNWLYDQMNFFIGKFHYKTIILWNREQKVTPKLFCLSSTGKYEVARSGWWRNEVSSSLNFIEHYEGNADLCAFPWGSVALVGCSSGITALTWGRWKIWKNLLQGADETANTRVWSLLGNNIKSLNMGVVLKWQKYNLSLS